MRYLILASPVFLASCGEPIKVGLPPPPSDWMVCEKIPVAPDLKPLEAITLADGRIVYLKRDVDARDGEIARYVVALRGAYYSCSNQLAKVRGYYGE